MNPPSDAAAGTAPTAKYLPGWQQDDGQHAFLGPRVMTTSPPRYVILRVTNAQENPHGAASDITLKAELAFGASDDVAPHPYKMNRTVGPLTIFAGRYVEGALFNVAGLANWRVLITKVDYKDIMKRKRSAAVGAGGLFSSVSGNILTMPRVFEPRKNEYTDAD
ncbi:MAG: hypothetical protein M3N13_05875 [Candidatus Eremiobacteraeota bacterium]|nr:hypothetical protein [Candidatus Eremiobacteraeota bacterium]